MNANDFINFLNGISNTLEQPYCYMHQAVFDEAVKQHMVYEYNGKWYTKYPTTMQIIIV